MEKNYYYKITVILSLVIISSCARGYTPTGNDAVYQLNMTVDPSEAGNVTPSSRELTVGDEVKISALPNEGWIFDSWQGDHTGTANPDTVTMDKDKDILALFIKKEYPLTVVYEGEGTVSEQVIQNKTTDHPYGTTVQLTATADEGWSFIRWENDLSGEQNPETITMDSDKTVTAVFEEEEKFSAGDGTETNPYQVSNIDELQNIANYPDAHFVQKNNIDASVTASWNDGKGFKPVGRNSPFSGTYDGGGFVISGLTINRPNEEYVGLFGNVDGAVIKNTGLVNITILGYQDVGGLIGVIYRGGIIENSHTTGNVSGNRNIGGLAGSISGTKLSNSHAIVEVSGEVNVGGLVGVNGSLGGRIVDSYSGGDVSGNEKVGGLVGVSSRQTTIQNSYATGAVTGTGNQIGGLVGWVDYGGHVSDSHATGNVTGGERIGGLIGDNGGGSISRCYATGNVSGRTMLGGLVGKIVGPGVIGRSHAIGNVSGISKLGGLVGAKYATHINDSFALGEISGDDEIGGLAGESIAGQIKNSYALGRVNGKNVVGGLVGVNDTGGHYNAHDAGQIFNSYAHGAVTGDVNVGGLAGINRNQAVITTSYAKGAVSGSDNAGGLVGLNEAGIVSSYWDNEATGQSNGVGNGDPNGSAGLTTAEMTGAFAETNMPEFDWISIWIRTAEYPILRWQN